MTDGSTTRANPLWKRILDTLSDEIDAGVYPAGAKLPTEAELSVRFEVNRHTVRRALEALRNEGRIHVRRGSGAYVTQGRFDYSIGPRTRLSRNLADQGIAASRRWLRREVICAEPVEARVLAIAPGDQVLLCEQIGYADGVPISYAKSSFPVARLPGLREAFEVEDSVTGALARIGIADYRRQWTRLTAERPGVMISRHLKMPEVHPVLLSESLNVDLDGTGIEYGRTWFCSDRVQIVVDRSTFTQNGNGHTAQGDGHER